jgi:hypothetical protein
MDCETILVVHDTTEFNLTRLTQATGFGSLSNSKSRGLFLQASLAVSLDDVPLGPLALTPWTRDPATKGLAKSRRQRGFDDKESARWWHGIAQAEACVQTRDRLLHVADREADIYEVMSRAAVWRYRVLIRADGDRGVVGAQALLGEAVKALTDGGTRAVQVPARPAHNGKPARAARTAILQIRYGTVVLRAPHNGSGSLAIQAIFAQEIDPPQDDALEWLLLTTDAVPDAAAAQQRIDWYLLRWTIEEWFKCLKTGCGAEKRQPEECEHFEVLLGLMILVSIRLLHAMKVARRSQAAPATTVFEPEEILVLQIHIQQLGQQTPAQPTVAWAVRHIAMMGGFMGRKGDGHPGWLTLWRGYARLCAMVEGYRLFTHAASLSRSNAPS